MSVVFDVQRFSDTLHNIRNRHLTVVENMAQGVLDMKAATDVAPHIEDRIQYFLDRFYLNRISIRMLIHQHCKWMSLQHHVRFIFTLFASSGKRNVTVWRPSVCPNFISNLNRTRGAYSTWLASGSTQRDQRTFVSGALRYTCYGSLFVKEKSETRCRPNGT